MKADLTTEVFTDYKREENPKDFWEGLILIRSLEYGLSPMWQKKRRRKNSTWINVLIVDSDKEITNN